jgi:hypothetical protein
MALLAPGAPRAKSHPNARRADLVLCSALAMRPQACEKNKARETLQASAGEKPMRTKNVSPSGVTRQRATARTVDECRGNQLEK